MPALLGVRLDRLYEAYNREDAAADPVQIVRRYSRREDQEVIGFCAASLAFGRVNSVLNTVETLARVLGPSPAAYVTRFDPKAPHPELRAMVHRWTRGVDIIALLWLLRQMLRSHCRSRESPHPRRSTLATRSTAFRGARCRSICNPRTAAACRRAPASVISFRGHRQAAPARG